MKIFTIGTSIVSDGTFQEERGTELHVPTVLDVLGKESALPLDGASLMPLLRGEVEQRETPIGFASRGVVAWHEGLVKVVFREEKPEELEWYTLESDPGETRDRASQPGTSFVRKPQRMQQAALEWLASCRRSNAGADYPAAKEE